MGERKKEKLNLKRFILKLLSLLGYDCSRVDIAPLGKGKKGSQMLFPIKIGRAKITYIAGSNAEFYCNH